MFIFMIRSTIYRNCAKMGEKGRKISILEATLLVRRDEHHPCCDEETVCRDERKD